MKALTVRQPWASLIAAGVKTIETRSQRTHHRGPLAIHAGLHRPTEGEDVGEWCWAWDVDEGVIVRQGGTWAQHPAPLGAVVAVAELVDCVPIGPDALNDGDPGCGRFVCCHIDGGLTWYQFDEGGHHPATVFDDITDQAPYGDFTPGRWAWRLANVRPLAKPIECRGAQGLWTVPDDIEAALREAVPA